MAGKLNLTALWILAYLRDNPGATLTQISDDSPVNEEKTAKVREMAVKKGWSAHVDRTVKSVEYPTAQRLVGRMLDRGLVRRDPPTIGPGESYRHFVVECPDPPKDPLEQAFAAPAVAGRPRLR